MITDIAAGKWVWKLGFLLFTTAGAWQDIQKRSISARTFQVAGVVGVSLRIGFFLWEANTRGIEPSGFRGQLWDLSAAVTIGFFLLILSVVTEEAIGRGDGSFFVVSGIYLGFWRNLILLWGSLLLSLPVCVILSIRGRRQGRKAGSIRIPFLPFVFFAGMGVVFL